MQADRSAIVVPGEPPDLSTDEIVDSGLLHTINEKLLWPLGLALVAHEKVDDLGLPNLSIRSFEDTIETALTPDQHRARHRAYEAFERNRRTRVQRSTEPDPEAEWEQPLCSVGLRGR